VVAIRVERPVSAVQTAQRSDSLASTSGEVILVEAVGQLELERPISPGVGVVIVVAGAPPSRPCLAAGRSRVCQHFPRPSARTSQTSTSMWTSPCLQQHGQTENRTTAMRFDGCRTKGVDYRVRGEEFAPTETPGLNIPSSKGVGRRLRFHGCLRRGAMRCPIVRGESRSGRFSQWIRSGTRAVSTHGNEILLSLHWNGRRYVFP